MAPKSQFIISFNTLYITRCDNVIKYLGIWCQSIYHWIGIHHHRVDTVSNLPSSIPSIKCTAFFLLFILHLFRSNWCIVFRFKCFTMKYVKNVINKKNTIVLKNYILGIHKENNFFLNLKDFFGEFVLKFVFDMRHHFKRQYLCYFWDFKKNVIWKICLLADYLKENCNLKTPC